MIKEFKSLNHQTARVLRNKSPPIIALTMICNETTYSLKTISSYDISNYGRKIIPRCFASNHVCRRISYTLEQENKVKTDDLSDKEREKYDR